MSPPTTSLAVRGTHPALALWWEELRRSESRQDPRAELLALNAAIKAYGPALATFGPVPGVPVGMIVLRRVELSVLGLHRHFLSDAAYSLQGVESLLLTGDEQCDDGGEQLVCAGVGRTAAQVEASLAALRASAKARRAVRVVRAVPPEELEVSEEQACAADAGGSGVRYRYDGLYFVQRNAADVDDALGAGEEQPRIVLQRAPGQPPLPATARGKRQRTAADHEHTTLSLRGEIFEREASIELPDAAEELLSAQESARERLSVNDALELLRRARDELLAGLQPGEAYLLARRSVLNQVRVRSAIELLHAGEEPQPEPAHGRVPAWHPMSKQVV